MASTPRTSSRRRTVAEGELSTTELLSRPVQALGTWRKFKGGTYWAKGGPVPGTNHPGILHHGWILVVRVFMKSAGQFRAETGRGGGSGFIVDSEAYWVREDDRDERDVRWVWHHENRTADEASARDLMERLKAWIDGQSLLALRKVPKAGPFDMSRLPDRF